MTCFFYIEGESESRTNEDAVLDACRDFISARPWKNRIHWVRQELGEGLDVGLNLTRAGSPSEFESEILLILEFLRDLASKLNISFVVGTNGEDRDVIGRDVAALPLPRVAEFLASE